MGLHTVHHGTVPVGRLRRDARAGQRVVSDGFTQAVADHHRDLARFAFRLCGDRDRAEDAVAEAYAKVWPRWHRGNVDELLPYLRRAVVNEVYSRGRRKLVEMRHAERPTARPRSGQFEALVGERDALAEALERLPVHQRVVVVLRVVEDLPPDEVADLLGVAPGTVKSRLSRALDALRDLLEDGNDA
jgi:RNA polymerase sigma-70 factor (sigma-E family)